ncbi:uncharacterized protein LOC111664305 [Seriola lalandi dorsalis]|uniref:uncharacterized protein LOC111664305 n=1 Tax=Seriola lalandi dorsalis TaxID=1841481 RepID=UPI000C6FAA15|nr:uncharacterized protein LOC111664305 [Seriola lalandi dorsalis]
MSVSGNSIETRPPPDVGLGVCAIWLKMSVDSDNSCVLLSSRDARTSCVFQTADEKDDLPGVGEESVLEMLSYSKFSDLETWLCMPSSLLLPRALDSTRTSSSSSSTSSSSHVSNRSSNSPPISSSSSPASNSRRSTCSEPGEADALLRSSDKESTFLTPALGREMPFLATPLLPILSSTPTAAVLSSGTSAGDSASQSGVSIRKRRRLAASPGGLHWNSAGSVQREFWSPDLSPVSGGNSAAGGGGARSLPLVKVGGASPVCNSDRMALRKTVSVDDRLLQPAGGEQQHLRLLSRLERGKKKLRNIHSLGTTGRYDTRKKLVLVPPPDLMETLQWLLVDFFWLGRHWLWAVVLYLPVEEGGQGLIDIICRTAAFRLQATQRLLYDCALSWSAPAQLILRKQKGGRKLSSAKTGSDDNKNKSIKTVHQWLLSQQLMGTDHVLHTEAIPFLLFRSDSKISRLAQRWNQRPAGDALIKDLRPLFYTGTPRSSLSLDRCGSVDAA